MKKILPSIVAFCLFCGAAETLYLNPSAECDLLRTEYNSWTILPKADLRVSYTDEAITLDAVVRKEPGQSFVQAGKAEDDMAVFSGDVLEFQLAPADQDGAYYHIALNPSGFAYTARIRDLAWYPEGYLKSNVVNGSEWSFKMAIPFASLNTVKPAAGTVWKVNLAISAIMPNGMRESANINNVSDYHRISSFGEIVFGKDAPQKTVQLRELRTVGSQATAEFEGRWMPKNVKAEYSAGDYDFTDCGKSAEGKFTFRFCTGPQYIPLKGAVASHLRLLDADTGEVVYDKSAGMPLFSSSSLLWLDRFYYIRGNATVGGKHEFDVAKATLKLYLDDKLVRTIANPPKDFSFSLEDAPSGRYVVEVDDGTSRTTRLLYLLDAQPKMEDIPEGARLRTCGSMLLLAGKPIYIISLSGTPQVHLQFTPALYANFTQKGAVGNAIITGGMPGGKWIRKPFLATVYPEEKEYISKSWDFLKSRKTKRNMLWMMGYEANIPQFITLPDGTPAQTSTAPVFAKLYKGIRSADLDAILTLHADKFESVPGLSPSCDVFEFASFPSSYSENLISNLAADVAALQALVPTKPLIFWLGGTVPNATCRTAEEMRCAMFYCAMAGIMGNTVHLGHGYLPKERSRLWSVLSGISAEINSFYADFATGRDISEQVTVKCRLPYKAVRCANGKTILLAVNLLPVERNFAAVIDGVEYSRRLTPFEPVLIVK